MTAKEQNTVFIALIIFGALIFSLFGAFAYYTMGIIGLIAGGNGILIGGIITLLTLKEKQNEK